MSILTFLTVLVVAYGVLGRGGYGRALALGGATAAGSAVIVGSVAVPTFYAVALGTVVALVLNIVLGQRLGPGVKPLPPRTSLLIAFFAWSTLVTVIAPLLFDGLVTVTPGSTPLIAGVVTSSNLAQIGYLLIGVCTVIYLGRSPSARPELIGLAAGAAIVLSAWRYLHQLVGFPFPEGVLDNSPSFAYIETAAGDIPRFRGIMSEPAALAGTALVCIAYFLPRAGQLTGARRVGALVIVGVAAYLGVESTSATFVVAGLATAVIVAAAGLMGFLARTTSFSRLVSIVGCAAVIIGVWVLPIVYSFVTTVVNDKLASASYTDRSSANQDSLDIFLDTWGVGVGIGSARASSFLPTLLSSAGAIGTLLFVAAVGGLLYRGSFLPRYRPVVWALVTLLVVKISAGPDLSDTTGVFWIALGVLSRGIGESEDHPAVVSLAPTPEQTGLSSRLTAT